MYIYNLTVHKHYLDNLQNQKYIVTRALERLERRTAEVLFNRQNWFERVRERQREEETQRDNEKKKVKREAALFKRHAKQVDQRMKELRTKEDQKRQEKYLNEAYRERMAMEDEAQWDPIEDVVEDERGTYVDMINMFLMLKEAESSRMKGQIGRLIMRAKWMLVQALRKLQPHRFRREKPSQVPRRRRRRLKLPREMTISPKRDPKCGSGSKKA